MKKIFTFLLLLSSMCSFAQEAPDITFTDTEGNMHNLYETLGEGKVVLLDFFFVNCGPCNQFAPEIDAIAADYQNTTLEVWAITDVDANAQIPNSAFEPHTDNHFVGTTDGGSGAVVSTYSSAFNFTGYPTYAVICSDKSITWDIWPITPGAEEIRALFTEDCGVMEASSVGKITSLEAIQLTPNPAKDFTNLSFYLNEETEMSINVYNALGQTVNQVPSKVYSFGDNNVALEVEKLTKGMYFVQLRSAQGVKTMELMIAE